MELILTVLVLGFAMLALALAHLFTGRAMRSSCGGGACDKLCATCPRRRSEKADG